MTCILCDRSLPAQYSQFRPMCECSAAHTSRVRMLISDVSVLCTGHLFAISSSCARCSTVRSPCSSTSRLRPCRLSHAQVLAVEAAPLDRLSRCGLSLALMARVSRHARTNIGRRRLAIPWRSWNDSSRPQQVSLAPALRRASVDLALRSVAHRMRCSPLVNGIFTGRTSFCFPALDRANFLRVEFESHTRSPAILRYEHHARRLEGDPQTPQRLVVRPAKPHFEIADRLQVDGRGLRQSLGRPFDHGSCSTALGRGQYVL